MWMHGKPLVAKFSNLRYSFVNHTLLIFFALAHQFSNSVMAFCKCADPLRALTLHPTRLLSSNQHKKLNKAPHRPVFVVFARRRTKNDREQSVTTTNTLATDVTTLPGQPNIVKDAAVDDDEPDIKLPGEEPDFWEGPQWDGFGFVVQYLWAFGVLFSLIACGIAVKTYNYGATDFKETPVYQEAIESEGIFDEPTESAESQIPLTVPSQDAPSPS